MIMMLQLGFWNLVFLLMLSFEKLGRAEEYDYDNPEHQIFVIQNARERQGVFA